MLVIKVCRNNDFDGDELVAAAAAAEVGDAFAAQAEDGAGLGAFGDVVFDLAVQRGHLHLGAEGGLDDGDGHVV